MLGVVGCGTMGNGIAQVFATYGHDVVLVDLNAELLEKAVAGIDKSLSRLVKKEKISEDDKAAALGRLKTSTAIADLADAEPRSGRVPGEQRGVGGGRQLDVRLLTLPVREVVPLPTPVP